MWSKAPRKWEELCTLVRRALKVASEEACWTQVRVKNVMNFSWSCMKICATIRPQVWARHLVVPATDGCAWPSPRRKYDVSPLLQSRRGIWLVDGR